MLQNLKNREYIQKLLNAESCDRVHDLWWDKPDGLFIKRVDTIFEDAVGEILLILIRDIFIKV